MKRELSSPCIDSALAWARDPAVWAWAVVGLLALLPLRAVFA
jgi:hypothetical protein